LEKLYNSTYLIKQVLIKQIWNRIGICYPFDCLRH